MASRDTLAQALKGHRHDSMSQDSGNHCVCGSDSRFTQGEDGWDKPWSIFSEHLADVVLHAQDTVKARHDRANLIAAQKAFQAAVDKKLGRN